MVNGETMTVTGNGAFNSANVVGATSVNVANAALVNGTGLASNYTLAANQTGTGTITAKALTANTIATKTYDATNTAAASVVNIAAIGMVGSESVSVTGNGTFNTANVVGGRRFNNPARPRKSPLSIFTAHSSFA